MVSIWLDRREPMGSGRNSLVASQLAEAAAKQSGKPDKLSSLVGQDTSAGSACQPSCLRQIRKSGLCSAGRNAW